MSKILSLTCDSDPCINLQPKSHSSSSLFSFLFFLFFIFFILVGKTYIYIYIYIYILIFSPKDLNRFLQYRLLKAHRQISKIRCFKKYCSCHQVLAIFNFIGYTLTELFRKRRRCSVKKRVLKNFANFTGKHPCWSLF